MPDWSLNAARDTAEIGGERLLYLRTNDLPNSWSLHFFVPDDQAVARRLLTGAVFSWRVEFCGFQIRRARQMGAALKKSEKEEAELRRANDRLAQEIGTARRTAPDPHAG